MEKKWIFNKEITENERKTISSFVEIKNGFPEFVPLQIKDICKKTKILNKNKRSDKSKETNKGYQFTILKELKNKNICDQTGEQYFIKPQYYDLVFSSLIQDNIKNLENDGLFSLLDSYVLGIKKKWFNYPEMNHVRAIIFESLNLHWRLKQIKKIFLIRDFKKKWDKFLKTDIHPAIKFWLWKIVIQYILNPNEQTIDEKRLEKISSQLHYFNINDEPKIKETRKYLKDLRIEIRKKLNKKKVKTVIDSFHPKLKKELIKYQKLYSKLIIELIKKDNRQFKMVKKILRWVLEEYPIEIERLGLYVDIGLQTLDGAGYHFNIPNDKNEKKLQNIIDDRYKKSALNKIKNQGVNFEDLVDLNNLSNVEKYMMKYTQIASEITEPKFAFFVNPQLDSIRNKIEILVKKEKGISISKDDLFHSIVNSSSVLEPEFYIKELEKKRN